MSSIYCCKFFGRSLPLCEVVSWNVISFGIYSSSNASTSVWGSELKCQYSPRKERGAGLPLCEVVSWNEAGMSEVAAISGLPLCEVVSWNPCWSASTSSTFFVYLCMRWWVETLVISMLVIPPSSTSVWGSELKCNGSPREEFFTDEDRRAMRIRIPIHPEFLEADAQVSLPDSYEKATKKVIVSWGLPDRCRCAEWN